MNERCANRQSTIINLQSAMLLVVIPSRIEGPLRSSEMHLRHLFQLPMFQFFQFHL
jgi:hypothetical protein